MKNFLRITDDKERHYGLDLIRVLAILSVILYHFPRNPENVILRAVSHYGYLGVDIFFVLSGFLIGGQVFARLSASKGFEAGKFFSMRFYRTLPLYYSILGIHILIEGAGGYDWTFLFFLQNIGGLYKFTHSWSLCVEEHFYILFPLLVMALIKLKKINLYLLFVFLVLLIGVLIRFYIWKDFRPDLLYKKSVTQGFEVYFKHIAYPTYTRLDGIAVGTGLAYIRYFKRDLWERLTSKPNLFLAISLLLFIINSALSWKRVMFFATTFSFTGYALCFGALLVSVISSDSLLVKLRLPFVHQISILSYSLYLSHGFAIKFLQKYFESMNYGLWPVWILIVPLSLAMAYLFYLGIEKPFLLLRDRKRSS